MLQTEWTGEKLLKWWRYLFSLLCAKEVMRNVQIDQVSGTATQQSTKQLWNNGKWYALLKLVGETEKHNYVICDPLLVSWFAVCNY